MHTYKDVCMIGIVIDGIGFTFMVGNYATHHLFQFIPERFFYQVLSPFDGKDELDV